MLKNAVYSGTIKAGLKLRYYYEGRLSMMVHRALGRRGRIGGDCGDRKFIVSFYNFPFPIF
jgi:hypothetical protein